MTYIFYMSALCAFIKIVRKFLLFFFCGLFCSLFYLLKEILVAYIYCLSALQSFIKTSSYEWTSQTKTMHKSLKPVINIHFWRKYCTIEDLLEFIDFFASKNITGTIISLVLLAVFSDNLFLYVSRVMFCLSGIVSFYCVTSNLHIRFYCCCLAYPDGAFFLWFVRYVPLAMYCVFGLRVFVLFPQNCILYFVLIANMMEF